MRQPFSLREVVLSKMTLHGGETFQGGMRAEGVMNERAISTSTLEALFLSPKNTSRQGVRLTFKRVYSLFIRPTFYKAARRFDGFLDRAPSLSNDIPLFEDFHLTLGPYFYQVFGLNFC